MAEDQLTAFVVDDDPLLARLLDRMLQGQGFQVELFADGESLLLGLGRALPDVVCLDLTLPGMDGLSVLDHVKSRYPTVPVIMLTAVTAVDRVVAAMQRGAYDYFAKPVDGTRLVNTVRHAAEQHRMALRLSQLEREAQGRGYPGLLGHSPAMRELFRQMDRVTQGDVTVLVVGESGTGKELVARALHASSGRRRGPFVALNCAAIPEGLQESELFGHEKGSFTGASAQRMGRFEQANGGTLFLDEVAELSPSLQAKLLRVVQQRSFQRVGGTAELRSDFRLLAATHRDLAAEVREGRFREDLYFRIAVFELLVPPLRERGDDVLLLAQAVLDELTSGGSRALVFSDAARAALAGYRWPGNVRELRNAVEHGTVVATGTTIEPRHLPARIQATGPLAAQAVSTAAPLTLRELERRAILDALHRNGGRVTAAARQLGLGRATLYRRVKELGIEAESRSETDRPRTVSN